MDFTQIIIKPLITEKSHFLREKDKPQYVFLVHLNANKHQIKMAFLQLFGVKPLAINTTIRKPRPTKYMLKSRCGYTKTGKIAYITVPAGIKIDFSGDTKKTNEKTKE